MKPQLLSLGAALTLIVGTFGACSSSTTTTRAPSSQVAATTAAAGGRIFVLVHGAFSAGYAWERLKSVLEADGQTVITLDLPAHGADQTPPEAATMDGYRDAVIKAIGGRRDVILVGHSFGGMVVSAVAEAIPNQLKEVVYLAAFLPIDGESALALRPKNSDSDTEMYLQLEPPVSSIKPDGVVALFCADCAAAEQDLLRAHPQPEPIAPLVTALTLTAGRFGMVPKFYIKTKQDRAVSPQFQAFVTSRATLAGTAELDTSHSPFLSAPEQLAKILESR